MFIDTIRLTLSGYTEFFLLLTSFSQNIGSAAILLAILASILMKRPISWAGRIASEQAELEEIVSLQLRDITGNVSGASRNSSIRRLYSRYSYNPILSIRSLLPLIVQLPFLILTYMMLKGLSDAEGVKFLWINDLSKPDQMFPFIAGDGNLLPILMLGLNIIAAFLIIEFNYKLFLQSIVVGVVFFFLLYSESAILLIFWISNNLIMLFRNFHTYFQADPNSRFDFRKFGKNLECIVSSREFFYFCSLLFGLSLVFAAATDFGMIRLFSIASLFFSGALFLAMVFFTLYRSVIKKKGIHPVLNDEVVSKSKVTKIDSILLLLPLTFIVQYAILNTAVFRDGEQLEFIFLFVLIFFVFVLLIPKLLSGFIPIVGHVPFLLAFSLIFSSFPMIVSVNQWYPGKPDLIYLFVSLGVVFTLIFYLFQCQRKILIQLSALIFFFNTGYTLYNNDSIESYDPMDINYSNFIASGEVVKRPDIYLLIYDSYVGQETMASYNLDNSVQEAYLESNGFKIYPETYSIGSGSRSTMSRVLEMSASLDKKDVYSTAGNALVPDVLKKHGYHTYGILTPYLLASPNVAYKTSYPELASGGAAVYSGLANGQFSFDLLAKARSYTHEDFVATKRLVFSSKVDAPKFVYTHTGPGHSQNSGRCLSNEISLFEERLRHSNEEMRIDVDTILSNNHDAIIIVSGDHGPYLTGSCLTLPDDPNKITRLDLQDSYGSFLAIRWPDESYKNFDNIRVTQDIFESVFKFLYETPQVLNVRVEPSTLAMKTKFVNSRVPDGYIVNGVIQIGVNKGQDLYINK